ncbi:MAG: Rv3654c family TadE-like protein [Actinomycetota bacterium]
MSRGSDAGNASIAILGGAAVFLAFLAGLADVGLYFHARARAQTAADAAALAAAAELLPSATDEPRSQAERFAEANGARLKYCECNDGSTFASVEVIVPVRFLLKAGYRTTEVLGRARAEVDPSAF